MSELSNPPRTSDSGPGPVPVRKPRLFYLDLVRALAMVLIVITHFNNPYLTNRPLFTNSPFNTYIGGLGVSLFLIISGAALMYNYGDRPHLDLKRFYWKRFVTLLPMFWIAFILANAAMFFFSRGLISHPGVPRWRLIFSTIGFDGYLQANGVATYYTLGEWFLGFIIIFYLVFPLLRWAVARHPLWTAVIIGLLYCLTLAGFAFFPTISRAGILTMRLPEFAVGMYLVRYFKRVSGPVALGCLAFLVVQQLTDLTHRFFYAIGPALPAWLSGMPSGRPPATSDMYASAESLSTTLIGAAVFLLLVWLAKWVEVRPVTRLSGSLSKYSYPIFLVHHVVIMYLFAHVNVSAMGTSRQYIVFVGLFALILGLSFLLDRFSKAVVAYVRSMFYAPAAKPNVPATL